MTNPFTLVEMIEETNHKYIKGMGRNITKTSHWVSDVVENSSPEILRPSMEGLAMTGGGRFFTVSSLSLHFVQGFGSEWQGGMMKSEELICQ